MPTSSSTAQHIVDEVAHYLDDAEFHRWSPQAVYHAIRRAAVSVARDLALAAPMKLAASASLSAGPGQSETALPGDFWFPIAVVMTGNGTSAPLPPVGFFEDGRGDGWYVRDGMLGIRLGHTASLQLRYVRRAAPPESLTETFALDEDWLELVVLRTARKLLAQKGLPDAQLADEEERCLRTLREAAEAFDRDFSGPQFVQSWGG